MDYENMEANTPSAPVQETTTTPKKSGPNMGIFIVIALVVIGIVVFFMTRNANSGESSNTSSGQEVPQLNQDQGAANGAGAVSQIDEMAGEGEVASAEVVNVEMEAGSFYFSPNRISAKKGQTVRVVLTAVDMQHNFKLDEFDVNTPSVTQGNSTTFEFVADKVGEFEFYCNVGAHRAQGQVGTLVVTE